MWRRFLVVVLAVIAMTLAVRAGNGFEIRGPLTANDTEIQEGYFAIAQDTVLMVRPGSELHRWLQAHAGQTVRIVVEPDATR